MGMKEIEVSCQWHTHPKPHMIEEIQLLLYKGVIDKWHYTGEYAEQGVKYDLRILIWGIYSISIKFDTWNNIENCTVLEENSVKRKPYQYRK